MKIPAEVSRSGQFQVTAQLVGADGGYWGAPVELSVESTAYGALTVIIIVVAGGVLVLMVAWRIWQRLRARAAGAAHVDEVSAAGANDPGRGRPANGQPLGDLSAEATQPLRGVIPGPTGPPRHAQRPGHEQVGRTASDQARGIDPTPTAVGERRAGRTPHQSRGQ